MPDDAPPKDDDRVYPVPPARPALSEHLAAEIGALDSMRHTPAAPSGPTRAPDAPAATPTDTDSDMSPSLDK